MRKRFIATAAVAALVAYFSLWPVDIAPTGWTPAALAESTAATRGSLSAIERLGLQEGTGPEGISLDASGRIYAGFLDGRVVRFSPDGRHVELLAQTQGRPWGTFASADGRSILVADAVKGLLKIEAGHIATLATQAQGVPFKLTDDVVQGASGKIYFSDASSKFGIDKMMSDVFEHGANGRLMQYDPVSKGVSVLMSGLHVANGVALGPDERYVLVSETLSYRVWRYWLKGEKAGQKEVFIDNLPGFPDNISFNGRDGFWLALYAPRDPLLDALLPYPALLKAAYRIPQVIQPKAKKVAHVLKLDLNGVVQADLQDDRPEAYAPITSVREFNGTLYFGSIEYPSVGQMRLPRNLSEHPHTREATP
ncbi:MAG TPA: SMP-30/gluconolactonase/LRE family protein [Aquabacterium sp.]|uniref:SMP-30/gluconolactonase/LRE family protein n=1 Tax=Aquabacterium sp. TaxID=1872578 RepID=UPI002E37798A|nr:SMP-30/gluconolactonase/LRE family protein [Aquabacterium sp.]HEX5373982.1 SMP-30/gluconolactonase/LRE family protein [Aquabacterium sp.]